MKAILFIPGQEPREVSAEGFTLNFDCTTVPLAAEHLGCDASQVEYLDTDEKTFVAFCVSNGTIGQPSIEPAFEAMAVLRQISPMPEAYMRLCDLEEDNDDDEERLFGPVLIVSTLMFSCSRCGQQWEKHPATVVACPDCHAAAGSLCKRPSGHTVPLGEVHVRREQAAVDAGLLPVCSAVGSSPAPIEQAPPPVKAGTQGWLF
jgi:hypothetical protein